MTIKPQLPFTFMTEKATITRNRMIQWPTVAKTRNIRIHLNALQITNGRNIKFKEEQPMDAFPAKEKAKKALWQSTLEGVGLLSQQIKVMDDRRRIRPVMYGSRGHLGGMRLQIKASSTCHDPAYSHMYIPRHKKLVCSTILLHFEMTLGSDQLTIRLLCL